MLLNTCNKSKNYKKYIIIFILSIFIISPKIYSDTPIYECGSLSSSGTYILQQDISRPGGTCINITAPDVTLDCNHKKIFDSNKGINIDKNNITIKNCDINVLNYGIVLTANANHNQILNSKILTTANYTSSPGYAGIYMGAYSGPTIVDNNIIDCNIVTTGNYNFGIELFFVSNSLIKDTNITTYGGSSSPGLDLYRYNYNNIIDKYN